MSVDTGSRRFFERPLLWNTMISTSAFACIYLPAFVLFVIAVFIIARFVARFQSKSARLDCTSLRQLESSYLASQNSKRLSILKTSSVPLLATPHAPSDLPISDCLHDCAHVILNYLIILPVDGHQKTTFTNRIQSFAKRHLPYISHFISGLTNFHVYRRVRQVISRDSLLVPDKQTNVPSIPTLYFPPS